MYATYLKIYISLTHNLFKRLKMLSPTAKTRNPIFSDCSHDQSYIPNFIANRKPHNKGINIKTERDWLCAEFGGNAF